MAVSPPSAGRAAALIARLGLAPHPEGGHYREVFRSAATVRPGDGRPERSALTTIDFLLARGERSAWHRVRSDEAWHLLEGGPLALHLLAPDFAAVHSVTLAGSGGNAADDAPGDEDRAERALAPRHVVPAGWWQAAEPLGDHALAGATVGPGFDFADFAFLRDDAAARARLAVLRPDLMRLL